MISDNAKIFLLFSILALCAGSLFTSSSFYTSGGNHGVALLVNTVEQLCESPKRIASDCLTIRRPKKGSDDSDSDSADDHEKHSTSLEEVSSSCAAKLSQVTQCKRAVAKAYQAIDMGHCLTYLQASSICKSEWCNDNDPKACERECAATNKALDKCVKENVEKHFQKAGLNSDGTVVLKK